MAEGKKAFLLYADMIKTVEKLPKEKAGELFIVILQYVNDLNPEPDDILIQVAFEPIKQQLKRDLKKWDKYIKKQRVNGKKGGRPKAKETQITQAFSEKPKKADNVNVSVNVNDNVNVDVVETEKQINNSFYEFFRRAAGSHIPEKELRQEVGKFRNKYPNIHPNQAGALINTWVSNIGKPKPKTNFDYV